MTASPLVSLFSHDNYDPGATLTAVRDVLAPLGGMAAFVRPGATVLLKPNLVYGRNPDKAINTHPAVAEAAARLAFEAGAGRVLVGDSPGYGTAAAAARACGLAAAMARCGAEMVEFTPVEHVDRDRRFVRLEVAREALAADVVVNLPKMKTHGQMVMSLAVKNMFGVVPGARKFQWHYRAGRDRKFFARMLNEIALAVRPSLSILDAVVGMDGMGPTSGRARPVGFVAAAADPWALDAVVMDIVGIDRDRLFTLADARENGPTGWEEARTVGASPASLRPADWDVPELVTLQMHGGFIERRLPGVGRWLRERLASRVTANDRCTGCGYCVGICPGKAMRVESGRVTVDGEKCIRCYCCHELCQFDGLDMSRPGWLQRILGM